MREKAERGEQDDDDNDVEMKGMDEKLKRSTINKESKIIIHGQMRNLDSMLAKTMEEKQRLLDEKLNQAGAKKK